MQININGISMLTIALVNIFVFKYVLCDDTVEHELEDGVCSGDTCQSDKTLTEEKRKYYIDKAREYHAVQTNSDDEMSDEELIQILVGFRDKTIDIENVNGDNIGGEKMGQDDTVVVENEEDVYEFPKLTVVEPGNVGDTRQVELEDGHVYDMITRSVQPPVFEIPNFLSDDECNTIIDSALKAGLNVSNLFGTDVKDEFAENLDLSEITRVSEQTWLNKENLDSEFLEKLLQRVTKLTGLPFEVIQRAEAVQVVHYAPGGHYHAHLDSVDDAYHLPCCFQTRCAGNEQTPEYANCCRLCRFITVLYYLNEPEEGGETAFPFADMSYELIKEKSDNPDEQDWFNLSHYCHNSSLVVKPKRGTAIMWYSHFVDKQTGYLGKVDRRSYHGGCDLIKGTKWIANTWISGATYEDRFKPSVYYNET